MLGFMSCQTVLAFAQCLVDSFRAAFQFDARPGLKFLVQKVSQVEVAANLYKQAGVAMTVYVHTLLEICVHQENICVQNTQNMLLARLETEKTTVTMHGRNGTLVADDGSDTDSSVDDEYYKPFGELRDSATVHQVALSAACQSAGTLQQHMAVFVCLLKEVFDEICSRYIDLYLEKEGPSAADELSQSLLIFLLAQPEELPSLKRDKSLKEMVAEKLKKKRLSDGCHEMAVESDSLPNLDRKDSVHSLSKLISFNSILKLSVLYLLNNHLYLMRCWPIDRDSWFFYNKSLNLSVVLLFQAIRSSK